MEEGSMALLSPPVALSLLSACDGVAAAVSIFFRKRKEG
jgi:hypothetical protein